jgi:argininosuccinate lyase
MDLRSKRLNKTLDPLAVRFLDSTDEDEDLLREDLVGTAVHAEALADAGVLTPQELDLLRAAVHQAYEDAQRGQFPLKPALEDVHMNVEAWLTQRLGELGKKIHTGRSRNDQVALDLRLAARRHLMTVAHQLLRLCKALRSVADKAPEAVLPGTTHLQPAQPVAFAHWAGMHVERLVRDLERLRDAYARLNVSPLGAAALAGTSHAIDPARTAERLAFDAAFRNSLDAVSDRDFLIEIAYVHAHGAVHLSQLAEDVILWAAPAYGFLELGDAHATGSSIMPQKRNPDVFEVVRAAAATAIGELTTALAISKGLPAAYNRDLQEQKRVLVHAWRRQRKLLAVLPDAVANLTPRPERMEAAAGQGHTDATELADHLVRRGVAFRDAHGMAADAVKAADDAEKTLSELTDDELAAVLGQHAQGVRDVLGPHAAVAAKTSPGGTALERVAEQHERQAEILEDLAAFFESETMRVAAAETRLLQPTQQSKVKPA